MAPLHRAGGVIGNTWGDCTVNFKQQKILYATILIAILMLLFPPLVRSYADGAQIGKGFGFLFSANGGAIVNLGLLFAEWFILAAISASLIYLNRNWVSNAVATHSPLSKALQAITEGWRRSRIFRVICIGAIAVDMLFAITNSEANNQVMVNSLSRAMGWTIFLVINFVYHSMRAYRGITEAPNKKAFSIKRVLIAPLIAVAVIGSFAGFQSKLTRPVSEIDKFLSTEKGSIAKPNQGGNFVFDQ